MIELDGVRAYKSVNTEYFSTQKHLRTAIFPRRTFSVSKIGHGTGGIQ